MHHEILLQRRSLRRLVLNCIFLYKYTENEQYLSFANDIMTTHLSEKYVLDPQVTAPFIFDHSPGNWSKQMELDIPIGYADYYFFGSIN